MNSTPSISLELSTENPLIEAGARSRRSLEIRVTAPTTAAPGQRLPLNLSLVLDRSGSMSGSKLENVKQAAAYVVEMLDERDRVSVVAFDDQVILALDSKQLSRAARDEVKRAIQSIRSGGSTNLSGGWLTGCQQVAQHQSPSLDQVDRALLLTDGLANAGISGVEELSVHARELSSRGITTSTFGVGEGFNEHLLMAMASAGGGSFTYISSPIDIPDIFAREFSEMMSIVAREVEVSITIPCEVDATMLSSWQHQKTAEDTTRVQLGSLSSAQEQNIHLELDLPPGSHGGKIPISVMVRGRSESGGILENHASLSFQYASPDEVKAAEVDKLLLERVALVRLSAAAQKSLEMERRGDAPAAAARLQEALQDNSAYLDPSNKSTYEKMVRRMREGMDELDRKKASYQSHLHSRQRHDPAFAAQSPDERRHSYSLLHQLVREKAVLLNQNSWLWQTPKALPKFTQFDRVEGMLLGLAVGDALGSTTEGMLPSARKAAHGEITSYLPNPHAGGNPVGLPSDDTQLTFWTLEVLLQKGELDPDVLARRFSQERIFGIGSTVMNFIRAYKDQGLDWKQAGQKSAGNGAVMRIAPVLLPYLRRPTPGLWADAVLAGMVTHNDYASNAACAALTAIYWELLGMQSAPPREWWAETFFRIAAPLEGKTSYSSRMAGAPYQGSIAEFVRQAVTHALRKNWTVEKVGSTWGSGAYLMETLPSALHILALYAGDPEQAVLRAVNDTKDNDTIAAIVGAAVGALHGKAALPDRWLSGLLGRTNDRNDGHIFRLIEQAKARFW
jgi:ADP-ribosyl-[dinitrogen reductase] hydrolase